MIQSHSTFAALLAGFVVAVIALSPGSARAQAPTVHDTWRGWVAVEQTFADGFFVSKDSEYVHRVLYADTSRASQNGVADTAIYSRFRVDDGDGRCQKSEHSGRTNIQPATLLAGPQSNSESFDHALPAPSEMYGWHAQPSEAVLMPGVDWYCGDPEKHHTTIGDGPAEAFGAGISYPHSLGETPPMTISRNYVMSEDPPDRHWKFAVCMSRSTTDRDGDGFPDEVDLNPSTAASAAELGVPGGPAYEVIAAKFEGPDGIRGIPDCPATSSEKDETGGFSWSMPERFNGRDRDRSGLADYFTPLNYSGFPPQRGNAIHPDVWSIDVVADVCSAGVAMQWTVDGALRGEGCATSLPIATGTHTVGLYADGGLVGSELVTPKDWLIVSLGDSYGSGEGVPDVKKKRNRGPGKDKPSKWQDKQCHRSARSATALAAKKVERADPQSSVTFLHLACSGATIKKGLRGKYAGAKPDDRPRDRKASQLDELASLLGGRVPDAVIVSIGGNDIGFGDIITGCIWQGDCQHRGAGDLFRKLIKKLPGAYDGLAGELNDVVPASPVFITKYPDATRHDTGKICGSFGTKQILFDHPAVASRPAPRAQLEITKAEAKWASETVSKKLNKAIGKAATPKRTGWTAIGSHLKPFVRHGYCADKHWVVQYDEANRIQERAGKRPAAAPGTMHPNPAGQRAYAKAIGKALRAIGLPG